MGNVFVFVHGAGGSARSWDDVLKYFSPRSLAVDLPGRNGKLGDLETLTVRDFAASVVDDMDAAEIGRAVVVGHSLGGLTLAALAEMIPERIEKLVFVGCVVPPDGKGNFDVCGAQVRKMVAEYGVAEDGRSLHVDALQAYYTDDMTPAQIEVFLDRERNLEARKPLSERRSLAGLMARQIPCVWVRLTRDRVITPEIQDSCIETIKACGCDCEVVDLEAGHMAAISRPRELAMILERFA